MSSKSKSQQRFFGMVHNCKKSGECSSPEVKKVADEISDEDAKDFASTKHKDLPEKKTFKEWTEDRKGRKTITIECNDQDNSLEDLLNYIKAIGNIGHSFSIIVDPEDNDHKKTFSWDGDGGDRIYKISK